LAHKGETMETTNKIKRVYRSRTDRMIGGVCAGMAKYFNMDPVMMRLIWVIMLCMGFGFLAYIVAWIIIPLEPLDNKGEKNE
jgi:phage shock protein C